MVIASEKIDNIISKHILIPPVHIKKNNAAKCCYSSNFSSGSVLEYWKILLIHR